jgi:hypothetical protein
MQECAAWASDLIHAFFIHDYFRISSRLIFLGTVTVVARSLTHRVTPFKDAFAIFNVNYMDVHTLDLGHLWSLSIGEKFHLFRTFTSATHGPRTPSQLRSAR